jgi:superfamily II DNA or RNA helicase
VLADHQVAAVQRCLDLLRTHGGALLADDVGLGKSFVAAEVMKQWNDVTLIVPAALVEQWRELTGGRILTHDALLRDPFVPVAGEQLIVVDEAHAFRNPHTQRYAALARRTAGARVLLVTATPVCNSVADLEALLRLIVGDDALADRGVPSIDVAFAGRNREALDVIVRQLVIRRDRSVLPPALQFGELERRVVRHPVLEARIIEDLRFPLVGDRGMLRTFLWRRLESSEAALAESVRRQLRFYDRALDCIASGRALPKRDYRRAFAHEEDRDAFQEVLFWELFAPPGEADPIAVREEIARLHALLEQLGPSPCVKRKMLESILTTEPTLIFTGSAATARDLGAVLRCAVITSRERNREAVLRAFCEGRIDLVVSTDMAAEGLNLQRAGVVIHYDIPWNPVRLDQRNGRAYRIGQKRDRVRAIYFLPESRETRIVETIARKNRVRRRVFEPVADRSECRTSTMRPRVAKGAGYLALSRRWELPDVLARRHKAGIELLMHEMADEYLDQRRIDDLIALCSGDG